MRSHKNSIEEIIFDLLFKPQFKYKGVPVSMMGLPSLFPYKKQSVANAVYRLKKEGYIKKDGDFLFAMPKSQKYIESKKARFLVFDSKIKEKSPKNLIVMFDIPEERKAEREWLRFHLKKFNYEMIQKSVWVGPSPLPKEFLDYVKEINLENNIKTFKLANDYTQKMR